MSPAVLQEIIDGTNALDVPEAARDQFMRLVRRAGAAAGVAGMAKAEHIDFARRLIRAGVSRPTTRDRLMANFEISRRQAYVLIDAALNCAEHVQFRAHVSPTINEPEEKLKNEADRSRNHGQIEDD